MNTVSKLSTVLLLFTITTPCYAARINQIYSDSGIETYGGGSIEAEQVIERHSLATHLGLGQDAVFTNPRSFRTEPLNSDHMDLEPLPSDSADDGAGS